MLNRNLSPRQLSALTALILSVPVALGIGLLTKNWKTGLISFGILLAGSYLLLLYIIQIFVYRKIKLIYKFIHQTKATRKESTYYKYILPQKSIDEVRQDVEAWAIQRSREVDMLKKNESYRKEFLQNLSHEFKTPVFAIQGYLDTLMQGALENPEVNRRFLEKASRNTERLVSLIRDLDEISKLERGELKLHKQNFSVQDLIREVFENLSWKADQRNISFQFKKGSEQPPVTVHADKEKIQLVLSNLVDNSIKYGKFGGSIVASVYRTDDKNVLIEISDDGMGIGENDLDRIFERFFRTNEGRGRDVTGSGLGLAICKHIIEAHGHAMHVRSKEGLGTSIGFTLSESKRTVQD